jgi:two-component system C4-dicarboxylate transport sensor histidine kinase DctB
LLLSRDATISDALTKGDYAHASQRLIQVQADISVASILLLDTEGLTVGATNRMLLGTPYSKAPFYTQAMQSAETVFSTTPREGGGYEFTYSQQVFAEGKSLGVIVVAVDLMKFERAWAALQDLVLVTDGEGKVILSTEPRWRGKPVEQAIAAPVSPSALNMALNRAISVTSDLTQNHPDAYVRGVAVLRTDNRMIFRGWHMASFTAYDSVRERVNGILALEIMGFAILAALTFYLLSRRAWSQTHATTQSLRRTLPAQLQPPPRP